MKNKINVMKGESVSNYIYKNPLDEGYKQFNLTKKQHNKLFKYRQIKWHDTYEYYYNHNHVILHKFYNWKLVVLSIILFPITVLIEGLGSIKETIHSQKRMLNQKKYGSFISDGIWRNSEVYNEIMEIITKD